MHAGVVKASLSCKDKMQIYVDGKEETDMIDCKQADQSRVFNLSILPTARLIAIEVESSGRPCIIGSFSDGKVTNSSWKCTSGTELDWKKPGFNDSLWKSAVKLNSGRERDLDRGCLINEIQRHGAKWITSADNGQQNMYCRLNRFVWCFSYPIPRSYSATVTEI